MLLGNLHNLHVDHGTGHSPVWHPGKKLTQEERQGEISLGIFSWPPNAGKPGGNDFFIIILFFFFFRGHFILTLDPPYPPPPPPRSPSSYSAKTWPHHCCTAMVTRIMWGAGRGGVGVGVGGWGGGEAVLSYPLTVIMHESTVTPHPLLFNCTSWRRWLCPLPVCAKHDLLVHVCTFRGFNIRFLFSNIRCSHGTW